MTKLTDAEFVAQLLANRFQNQPWYIKLFRSAWLMMLPLYFCEDLWFSWSYDGRFQPYLTLLEAIAHCKGQMGYCYTLDEILGKDRD